MRSSDVSLQFRYHRFTARFSTSSDMLPFQGKSHIRTIRRYATVCFSDFMGRQEIWTASEPTLAAIPKICYVRWQDAEYSKS